MKKRNKREVKALNALIKSKNLDDEVKLDLLYHPLIPKKAIIKLYELIKNKYEHDYDSPYLYPIAANPNTPEYILYELYNKMNH